MIKQRMFELHSQNPEVWKADKVARVFGVPRGRVKAILTLCKLEAEALPAGADDTDFDGSVEKLLEQKFGVQLAPGRDKTILRQERYQSPKFFMIDEDEGPLQEFGWERQARIDRAPAREMSESPAEEFSQFHASRQVTPPDADHALRKFRLVAVDTSQRYRDEERPIVVEETDKSVRTVDWTERRTLMTLYRARSRNLRSNIKGHLANELMIDVDKFFNTEPKPIGLPEFWPNNKRPSPGFYERFLARIQDKDYWEALKEKTPEKTAEKVVAEAEETVEDVEESVAETKN